MKIKTLVENTSVSEEIESAHGLSLYIEAASHKILFDVGPGELFLSNAKKMAVDIADVDLMILSHGHYDHGDGIPAFLEANQKAAVHVQKGALDNYYAHDPDKIRYVGVTLGDAKRERIEIHSGDYVLAPGIQLFSGITERKCYSRSNDTLFMEENGKEVPDQFSHEQNLLISDGGKNVLIAGCAHNGIVNIMEKVVRILGQAPDYVFSGFHLMNPDEGVSRTTARMLAEYLRAYSSQFYTCHCTGLPAYEELHRLLGEQIKYLAAGMELEI